MGKSNKLKQTGATSRSRSLTTDSATLRSQEALKHFPELSRAQLEAGLKNLSREIANSDIKAAKAKLASRVEEEKAKLADITENSAETDNSQHTDATNVVTYLGVLAVHDAEEPVRYSTDEEANLFLRKFIRDWTDENGVTVQVPEQFTAPPAKEPVPLDKITDEELAEHVAERESRPEFVAALEKARATKASFQEAATLPVPLPTVAPEPGADRPPNAEAADYRIAADTPFWKDRDTTDPRNPVEFIKGYYGKMKPDGTWDNAGLTRPHLKRDAQLYAAYATWIGRHPNDALTFAPGRNAGRYERIDNPQEFMERRRASEAQSRSKAKAGRREDTPEPG